MRICYFYTRKWDKAVAALPPDTEMVWCGRDKFHYWEEFCKRWGADDLMFIEHDNVIHDTAVKQFEECPNSWCVFPYWNFVEWLCFSLGTTRFRKELMTQVDPEDIQRESTWARSCTCEPEDRCWHRIDKKLAYSLCTRGYKPCIHMPYVEHIRAPLDKGYETLLLKTLLMQYEQKPDVLIGARGLN